jgi:hypothetical protein
MKYAKPDVTVIGRAVATIQGIPKSGSVPDLDDGHVTTNAYEADE